MAGRWSVKASFPTLKVGKEAFTDFRTRRPDPIRHG